MQKIDHQFPLLDIQSKKMLLELKEKEIENILKPFLTTKQKERAIPKSIHLAQETTSPKKTEVPRVNSAGTVLMQPKPNTLLNLDAQLRRKEDFSAKSESLRINSVSKLTGDVKSIPLSRRSQRSDSEFYQSKSHYQTPVLTKDTARSLTEETERYSTNNMISPLCSSRIIEIQKKQPPIEKELLKKSNDSFSFQTAFKERMKSDAEEEVKVSRDSTTSLELPRFKYKSLQELGEEKEREPYPGLVSRQESLKANERDKIISKSEIEKAPTSNNELNTSIEQQIEQNPQVSLTKISEEASSTNNISSFKTSTLAKFYQFVESNKKGSSKQSISTRADSKQSLHTHVDSKLSLSSKVGSKQSIRDQSRGASNVFDEKESESASFQNSIVLEEDTQTIADFTIDQSPIIKEELGSDFFKSRTNSKKVEGMSAPVQKTTIDLQVEKSNSESAAMKDTKREQQIDPKNEESKHLKAELIPSSSPQLGEESNLDVSPSETRTHLDTSRSRRLSTLDYSQAASHSDISNNKKRRRRTRRRFVTDYSKFSIDQLEWINALENFDLKKYETEGAEAKKESDGRLNSKPFEELSPGYRQMLQVESKCLKHNKADKLYEWFGHRDKSPSSSRKIGEKTHIIKDRPDAPTVNSITGLESETNRNGSPTRRRSTRGSTMPPRPKLSLISDALNFRMALHKN